MLSAMSTEYICLVTFDTYLPDIQAWQAKLLELGLHREAFSIASSLDGNTILKFWERDRPEALRILAGLDEIRIM